MFIERSGSSIYNFNINKKEENFKITTQFLNTKVFYF